MSGKKTGAAVESRRPASSTSLRPGSSTESFSDSRSGLYLALHDFECNQQHVLTFKKGQIVEVTRASSSTNWHRGKINGKAGFLPANGYLRRINLESCGKVVVRQDFEAATSGQLKIYEGQVLTVIAKNDVQWWTVRSDAGKWGEVPAKYLKIMPLPLSDGNVTVHSPSPTSSPGIVISRPAAQLARTQSQGVTTVDADLTSIPRSSTIARSSDLSIVRRDKDKRRDVVKLSSSLVEGVRRKGVKYQTSKEIVLTVLERLMEEYPEWDQQLGSVCKALDHESDMLSNSVDSLKLEQLFEQLNVFTEDEQQRGWSCADDTAELSTLFTDLASLLNNANPKVVIAVLQRLKYEPLLTTVQYYQLESRAGLKKQALEVLYESTLIQPEPICSILLTSRLPIQLATDIQGAKTLGQLECPCKLFSAVLSHPNVMPRTHFDQLDERFITHLLTEIESTERPPDDPDGILPNIFLKCILSLNLHYTDVKNNRVCDTLKSRTHASNLTEMLLVAFNRAENLTAYFPVNVNSVNKLVTDMMSNPDTAELFFTNDVKVLIEVLNRNIIDRGEGDTERLFYLELLDLVLTNTEYQDHYHMKSDITDILNQVGNEESTDQGSKDYAAGMIKKHIFLSS